MRRIPRPKQILDNQEMIKFDMRHRNGIKSDLLPFEIIMLIVVVVVIVVGMLLLLLLLN